MSCEDSNAPAGMPLPCIVQGMTMQKIQFIGTVAGVRPDLAHVDFKVGVAGQYGVLMHLDSGSLGGITITDPVTWSFEIDKIENVDLPVCELVYTITQTDAAGDDEMPFQGTWTILSPLPS